MMLLDQDTAQEACKSLVTVTTGSGSADTKLKKGKKVVEYDVMIKYHDKNVKTSSGIGNLYRHRPSRN